MIKKRFINRNGINWRRLCFNVQAVVLSPVLLTLIAINYGADWLLQKWSDYREWFIYKGK